jgi:hypothetical protein
VGFNESVESMWSALTEARPDLVDERTTHSAWHFCDNESDANELVELVLAGRKRATAGLLSSYESEGEPLPQVGDLSVVTDWDSTSACSGMRANWTGSACRARFPLPAPCIQQCSLQSCWRSNP